MSLDDRPTTPTESEVAASDDAVAGLAMVRARMAHCSPAEQAAFWEAVGRCFGGGKPPEMPAAEAKP
jgi:hypothetical protein